MDPLRDFDDARTLGEPELRARLRDGAPVERVWCAWQLGLRRAGSHDVAEQVKREPHPSVRRHLAVAVAGAHDVDVLVAMARHDPDSGVRSTAMLLATRFAAAGVLPWAIIEAGLADEAPGVRDPAVVDALDWRIDGDLAEVPLAVLLRWLVSGEDWRLDARLDAAADQLRRDRTTPRDLVAAAVARVTAVRAAVLQDLAHPDPDDTNPDRRSPAEATAVFDRFLAATARHA